MLRSLGISFRIIVSDCDETAIPNESAEDLVKRLALKKAKSVAEKERASWVVGADTIVAVEGRILGKPTSKDEAAAMLQLIQGREHIVYGGIAIVNEAENISHVESHRTRVTMKKMSAEEISDYVASGEPMDKAGSYAIQGIGASLVESVNGSYTNVVGMNLTALIASLGRLCAAR